MSRKHVYLQLIEIADTLPLRYDPSFVRRFEFSIEEDMKLMQTEYGMLKHEDVCYHILIGQFPTEGCYWCGHELVLKKFKTPLTFFPNFYSIVMECTNCCSRGPMLRVNERVLQNGAEEEYNHFVRERYKQINAFRGFKNPYKEEEKSGGAGN